MVEDKAATLHGFAMQGDYELKNQIDISHSFLYGHRYWKTVKEVIERRAEAFKGESGDLEIEAKQIAQTVANEVKGNVTVTLGISLIGLMTLVQSGLETFKAVKGEVKTPKGLLSKSPDAIVAERGKDDSQGLFGFLKSVNKKFTVTWNENSGDAKYDITNDEDVATASARDQSQNWKAKDERCWEGVVPVECRSAACGTCWVGVLGGKEKLSEVSVREAKQMKIFGYQQPEEAQPYLRLACQARTSGNVTIVIPPWNAVFGRKLYGVDDVELEPATTSAKKLRETIATAAGE